jgi:hypothetical protein
MSDDHIEIPETPKEIDEEFNYIEIGAQNPWSKELSRKTQLGPQYQYTQIGEFDSAIRELNKLAYGIKVQRFNSGENSDNDQMLSSHVDEIRQFYLTEPRLVRRYDDLRIGEERALKWAMTNPDEYGADYILGYELDSQTTKSLEDHGDNRFWYEEREDGAYSCTQKRPYVWTDESGRRVR